MRPRMDGQPEKHNASITQVDLFIQALGLLVCTKKNNHLKKQRKMMIEHSSFMMCII